MHVEMQYVGIFNLKCTRFVQNKGIFIRNHDYGILRSKQLYIMGMNNEEAPFIIGVLLK